MFFNSRKGKAFRRNDKDKSTPKRTEITPNSHKKDNVFSEYDKQASDGRNRNCASTLLSAERPN